MISKPTKGGQSRTQEVNPGAAPSGQGRSTVRERWGGAIDAGFVVVPSVLIRAQSLLGLDTVDLAIVLNVVMHWWRADELPYPRPSAIARRIGVSTRTVERRLVGLQNAGLLVRHPPEKARDNLTVRRFDLSGLVEKLGGLAERNLAERPPSVDDEFLL